MRRSMHAVLVLLIALVSCATFSKDAPAINKVSAMRIGYTETLNTLSDLRDMGALHENDIKNVELVRRQVSPLLDDLEAVAKNEGTLSTALLMRAQGLLDQLALIATRAQMRRESERTTRGLNTPASEAVPRPAAVSAKGGAPWI